MIRTWLKIQNIRNVDVFVMINAVLYFLMCAFVYFHRFIEYRGVGNLHEFFIYAVVIFSAILIAWWYMRDFFIDNSILILIQVGIAIHFAGAFVPFDGQRLYDAYFLGIRYDKYVHLINSFITAAVTSYVLTMLKAQLPLGRNLAILLIVLGMGALIEIMEYLVMLTVENAGVGSYDNNMQDLISNFAGGLLYIIATSMRWGRRTQAAPEECR
jgi:hypothetical protein